MKISRQITLSLLRKCLNLLLGKENTIKNQETDARHAKRDASNVMNRDLYVATVPN